MKPTATQRAINTAPTAMATLARARIIDKVLCDFVKMIESVSTSCNGSNQAHEEPDVEYCLHHEKHYGFKHHAGTLPKCLQVHSFPVALKCLS